ncbi:MAG: hypothetical protein CMN34_08435, partial [Saprospirales bacterium]|nr:hypothetical protein [Saprospirales bacterium]
MAFSQTWTQIGQDIDGIGPGDECGWSVSFSSSGNRLALSSPADSSDRGNVRVYEWDGVSWIQIGQTLFGSGAFDFFGGSVSFSSDGNRLAIGAGGYDANGNNAGLTRVVEWNGNSWIQLGNAIGGEAAGDESGSAVSISSDGSRIAIGALYNDNANGSNAGHVRVYEWDGNSWGQVGQDIDGLGDDDLSGRAVSMSSDGNRVAVGSPLASNYRGNVCIYDWNGTSWIPLGNPIIGEAPGDESGYSVSISANGNRVVIGAPRNDAVGSPAPGGAKGHVRVYNWNGTGWVQLGQDIDGESVGDFLGVSVSISANGNRVATGAPQHDANILDEGHVRVYDWNGISWVQVGQDLDGEARRDNSGHSVSFSSDGRCVAIGAIRNDAASFSNADFGHVRVYRIDADSTIFINSCDSFFWSQNNTTYYSSGVHSDTTYTAGFIDSIFNLYLSLSATQQSLEIVDACDRDSFIWARNNQVYYTSGIYNDTLNSYSFLYDQTIRIAGNSLDSFNSFSFLNSPSPLSDATIDIRAFGDIDANMGAIEQWTIIGENNFTIANIGATGNFATQCNDTLALTASISQAQISSWAANGAVELFAIDSTGDIDLDICNPDQFVEIRLRYSGEINCRDIAVLDLSLAQEPTIIEEVSCDSFYWVQTNQYYTLSGLYSDTVQRLVARAYDSVTTIAGLSLDSSNNFSFSSPGTPVSGGTLYISAVGDLDGDGITSGQPFEQWTIFDESSSVRGTLGATGIIGGQCSDTLFIAIPLTQAEINAWSLDGSIDFDVTDLTGNVSVDLGFCIPNQFVEARLEYQYLDIRCDSIVTLDLTINNSVTTTLFEQACDSFTWNGQVYSSTGIYRDTFTTLANCDSIVILDLTVNNSSSSIDSVESCDSFYWSQANQTYYATGVYSYTTVSSNGCDSTIILDLTILNQIGGRWVQLGQDIDGQSAGDFFGLSVIFSSDGTRIAVAADFNDANGNNAGHVRVYDWNSNSWIQAGQDILGEAANDLFGSSVAFSSDGNRLAIGAIFNDASGNDAGHVRVYDWDGSFWVQVGQDIDGELAGDHFGRSVSFSSNGNHLAIGAPYNDGNGNGSGHVRVYDWDGAQWNQQGQDIDGEAAGDNLGQSVSFSADGSRLAIGASNDAGYVRVYDWDGNLWVQTGQDIDGEASFDYSGESISLSSDGNRLAIGAIGNDGNGSNSGHTRVYTWNGALWVQLGSDIDGESIGDLSGSSVSFDSNGNRLVIGASYNNDNGNNAGHARVYEWDGISWVQLGQDMDGEAADDNLGWSANFSSNGNRLVVGAPYNDDNGDGAGQARVYEFEALLLEAISDTIDAVACDSFTWTVNSQTYLASGLYGDTLFTQNGCDSVYAHLNLTINNSVLTTQTEQACDSFVWNGQVYTTTGVYQDTFATSSNCDSIEILDLTINNSVTTPLIEQACDSFVWNGQVYTTTGIYRDTFATSSNCDSIEILDLTI